MGQSKITTFLLVSILLLIMGFSILYGVGFWKTDWHFKSEVQLVDLINIIVTISCSLAAAWIVAKKLSEERFKKELEITDLKKIEEQIGSIIDLFVDNGIPNDEQCDEILVRMGYLRRLIRRFQTVYSITDNHALISRFNTFYAYSTNFYSDNEIDIQSVIQEGDILIKTIRNLISEVNEN